MEKLLRILDNDLGFWIGLTCHTLVLGTIIIVSDAQNHKQSIEKGTICDDKTMVD